MSETAHRVIRIFAVAPWRLNAYRTLTARKEFAGAQQWSRRRYGLNRESNSCACLRICSPVSPDGNLSEIEAGFGPL